MTNERRPGVFDPSVLDAATLYTPVKEAGLLLKERWQDATLRKKVEKRFGEAMPKQVLKGPHGIMWRHICTPDREFKRFLELCVKAGVEPLGFESVEDRFVSTNFTKLALTNLVFMTGLSKHGKTIVEKEKIIDFTTTGKKRMSDLRTLWGESLVDFHHWFLQTIFPIMKGRVVDIYAWNKRQGGSPREYYPALMAFALAHFIIFDDFDLLAAEDEFTKEVVLPAFHEIEKEFGIKPLIVKISKQGEHAADQYWWCYATKARQLMHEHRDSSVWT